MTGPYWTASTGLCTHRDIIEQIWKNSAERMGLRQYMQLSDCGPAVHLTC